MISEQLRIWLGTRCKHTRPCEDTGIPFFLTEELLQTHLSIFGGTRQGKSKLFEQIFRELIRLRRGFAYIDPHGDTADDVFAYLANHQEELGLQRLNVHYLNPAEKYFTYDLFHYEPMEGDRESATEAAYHEWLHSIVLDLQKIIVRVMGETEADAAKQVRLNRWLRNVLYAVGIRHSPTGEHFGLEEALILLSPSHPEYAAVVETVLPLLNNPHTRLTYADLRMLIEVKDTQRRENWTESAINRLRTVLSPVFRRIFQPRAARINFRHIIASNGIILASLGKQPRFHQIDGQILGGLLIRSIADAVKTVKRTQRQQYYLAIDEAQNFMGEDLDQLLKESGKYKLSLCLAVQSLNNLTHGDVDVTETVLGQCGIRLTFQQQHFPVAQLLTKDLGHSFLDFSELIHTVQQHDGYDKNVNMSISLGTTNGQSQQVSAGQSKSLTSSESHSQSNGWADQTGASLTTGSAHSIGQSSNVQHGLTHSTGTQGNAAGLIEQFTLNVPSTQTSNQSLARNTSQSQSESNSSSWNESRSLTESQSVSGSEGFTTGSAAMTGTSVSEAIGQSQSASRSVTFAEAPRAKYKFVKQQTGQLEKNLDVQDRNLITTVQELPKQHCIICVGQLNMAAVVRVADVHDPFEQRGLSGMWKEKIVAGFKRFIFQLHSYYFDRETALDDESAAVVEEPLSEVADQHFPV